MNERNFYCHGIFASIFLVRRTHSATPDYLGSIMRNGEVFKRCLLACEAASQEAGFAPEVGRDLYLGQMSNYFLGWSHQQFGKWVFFMVELHGEKSTEGVELAELFSEICNIIVTYGKLGY